MILRAGDFETFPIRHLDIAPKPVTISMFDGTDTYVRGNGDEDFWNVYLALIDGESVWHNASFDHTSASLARPDLIPQIVKAYLDGRIHCTKNQEKLISIAEHGNLRVQIMPNGYCRPITYELSALESKYLKVADRSAVKGNAKAMAKAMKAGGPRGDSLRFNFDTFDGWKAAEYPADALAYVQDDAKHPWEIHQAQRKLLDQLYWKQLGKPFDQNIATLHAASDYVLYMTSALGVYIDLGAVHELSDWVESQLCDENLPLLIASGVLRPSQPERDSLNGRQHYPECPRKNCSCPRKKVAAKRSTLNKKVLQALVVEVCEANDLHVEMTDPSDKFPEGQVSVGAEIMEEIKDLHPVLGEYSFKTNLDKIRTTEVPRMSAPIIHTKYDPLKVSFRTSCGADDNYPSGNIQNVDPRARHCYIPPPTDDFSEWGICSIDFSGMELVTLAQTVYKLLGRSTHRDYLNRGVDMHALLGSQLAYNLRAEFREYCAAFGAKTVDEIYAAFKTLAKGNDEQRAFYKEFRTFAKPTGLGYPGGLGPKTFISFAKGSYNIKGITLEMATRYRDIWYELHPDMHEYFNFFKNHRRDPDNSRAEKIKKTGETKFRQRYWYETAMGALRRGCAYSDGVNGMGLQSPGAELAKMGFLNAAVECIDQSRDSVCWTNARPAGFVHDEGLFYVRLNENLHEVCNRLAECMVEGGQTVVPDVVLKAEPCVMKRWNKGAEPRFDENKRLILWEPKQYADSQTGSVYEILDYGTSDVVLRGPSGFKTVPLEVFKKSFQEQGK